MPRGPGPLCAVLKDQDPTTLAVFMFTPTLPGDAAVRQLVRETWWADIARTHERSHFCESLHSVPRPDQRRVCIDARFTVGTSSDLLPRIDKVRYSNLHPKINHDELAREADRFGDIIHLQVEERGSSHNTAKMSLTLSWVLHHRRYADYVIKTDADTYVYLPRFIQHLPMPVTGRELVLVGRAHPGHFFRDSPNASRWKCPGGEVEGLSSGLLRLLASTGGAAAADASDEYDSSESDVLTGLLVPPTARSRWANGDLDWVERYEDIFLCAIVDRALQRHPSRRLDHRLRRAGEFTGLWVHSGRLKHPDEFRRCHSGEKACHGEAGFFKRPAVWNGSDCGGHPTVGRADVTVKIAASMLVRLRSRASAHAHSHSSRVTAGPSRTEAVV